MPSSEAHVPTSNARRHVAQLCRHFAREAKRRPGLVQTETVGPAHSVASFDAGRCDMRARDDSLVLRLEAVDQQNLVFLQEVIGRHLERFGRREDLSVRWMSTTD